jgi:hypothetical protein
MGSQQLLFTAVVGGQGRGYDRAELGWIERGFDEDSRQAWEERGLDVWVGCGGAGTELEQESQGG